MFLALFLKKSRQYYDIKNDNCMVPDCIYIKNRAAYEKESQSTKLGYTSYNYGAFFVWKCAECLDMPKDIDNLWDIFFLMMKSMYNNMPINSLNTMRVFIWLKGGWIMDDSKWKSNKNTVKSMCLVTKFFYATLSSSEKKIAQEVFAQGVYSNKKGHQKFLENGNEKSLKIPPCWKG